MIRTRGGEAVANYDDVADFGGAENLIATAVDAFGGLDILVNNAGIVRDKMMFSMTRRTSTRSLRVHLKGTFAATKFACICWRERSKAGDQLRAAIVNTVSSAGLQGNVGQANYGSAKAGIAAPRPSSPRSRGPATACAANAVATGGVTRITGGV